MSDADGLDPYLLEQLPTLPGTAVAFLRLCDDPHAGVAEVAKVAERDPALLARVLQVANSPFYGTREPITDVVRAGAILGLRNLKLIGVGFAIVGDLWAQSDASKTLSGLIGASALAGAGARSFSETVGTGRDEEAFTSGLLGFVGELALLRCMPDEFESLWEQSDGLPSKREQRARLGTDGATVGSVLLAKWNLPAGLRTAADARSETVERRTDATNTAFVAAAGFGTALAEALMSGEAALSKMASSARSWGLDRDELLRYWDDFRLTLRRVDHDLDHAFVLGMAQRRAFAGRATGHKAMAALGDMPVDQRAQRVLVDLVVFQRGHQCWHRAADRLAVCKSHDVLPSRLRPVYGQGGGLASRLL